MRLLKSEVQEIKDVLMKYSPQGEIFLHGSRIDDALRGGDIDLFWVLPSGDYARFLPEKYSITAEISILLREQRIDLALIDSSDMDSFFLDSKKIKLS